MCLGSSAIFRRAVLFLLLSGCILGAAMAQPVKDTASGAFTADQAKRGENFYQQNCAACHGGALQGEEENPPLSGKHFSNRWGGLPVGVLFGFVNSQMPLGQPGSLGAQANIDIVAYILSINKFPAGQTELPPDAKALGTITINKQ